VLVHPPGGLVGGDTLDIAVQAASHTHGLVTTPGATRFYRSEGPLALQTTRIALQADARLEWLPLEALCYNDCNAENRLVMDLEPGAELLGWDLTAFGLPKANLPFVKGSFAQHIEVPGVWLERGRIHAADTRLMDGPTGLNGARCMASLFFVTGAKLDRTRKQQALDIARALIADSELATTAGATSPNPQVIVVRVVAPLVEPAMQLLRAVRNAWRHALWQLPDCNPRIWAM
jgi:urease accessory protein